MKKAGGRKGKRTEALSMGRGKGANSRKSTTDDISEQKLIFMHINGGKRCVGDEQSA